MPTLLPTDQSSYLAPSYLVQERAECRTLTHPALPTPFPPSCLVLQAAVPKHAKLQINPPSSTTIPPNNSGTVTQIFRISNPMHDQKLLSMRIKLDFTLNGSPVADVVQLDGFPAGV